MALVISLFKASETTLTSASISADIAVCKASSLAVASAFASAKAFLIEPSTLASPSIISNLPDIALSAFSNSLTLAS